MARGKDFFISYNKADRTWAEWVAWHLEEAGHSVAIQAWDFGPGCNFVVEMDNAIQECARIVAILSPDYLTSLYTKPEWAAYFAQDPTSEDRKIVPVRVRVCELKGLLAQIVYTDLVGKPEDEAKTVLLADLRPGRHKPASAPQFPGNPPRAVPSRPRFPGALPDIWNVPHLRNPNFTEPGTLLADLRTALQSGQPAALTQAVTGLGGLGKTQLATEYAYRHAADYALVWWLRAEQPVALAADYAALAAPLGLPEQDAQQQPLIAAAVRAVLRHRQDFLLIFDNANTAAEIRDLLPQGRGHVLITSRDPAWRGLASQVPVKKWPAPVAVEFLLKRTGQTDAASAQAIAEEMDCLPLALEQAGAYIEAAQKTLAGYLTLFRQHRLELLKRGQPSTDYPDTVATTWELAFQRLETESPAGAALLSLCAFLAPDEILSDVITAGAKHLPAPLNEAVRDPLAFDDAVRAIRHYSLIEAGDESTLSMHRLVQAIVRDRLDEPDRRQWAEAAMQVINAAFPNEASDVRTWKECDRLLPHATTVTEYAEGLEVGLAATARLLNQMGVYALGRAEYVKAKATMERALKIDEKAFGPDHPEVAIDVNNLGNVLQALGDFPAAKAAYERALKIDERTFGPDHPKVGTRVNNLGSALQALGDFPAAKAAYERALKIDEKAFGPDHPNVATRVNNLGDVLRFLGDFSAAKAAFERALKIDEKAFGSDHPKVAIRVNNLGSVLQALGDFSAAKAAYERALKIDERAFGPDHPKVAIRVNNLGRVLQALDDFSAAKAAYERAFKIFQKSLGDNHPNTRLARENLDSLPD